MVLPAAWWRVHHRCHGPWWYSSSPPQDGRFDLDPPRGTCYLASEDVGAFIEVFRNHDVNLALEQIARADRRLAQMPLDTWIGSIANFTAPEAASIHHVPPQVSTGPDHSASRLWAEAARKGGFGGIAYWLSQDPTREQIGLALFGEAKEHPPDSPWTTTSTDFAVGTGKRAAALYGGRRSA